MGHFSAFMILALCLAALPAHGQSPFSDIHVEFDGDDVRVHNPGWEWLSSVFDTISETSVYAYPGVTGFSGKTWELNWSNRTAVVGVRWNDTDDMDYLAGGWWARQGVSGFVVNAFIDGPELRGALPDTMTLPIDGKATYEGEVDGFYQRQVSVTPVTTIVGPPSRGTLSSMGEFEAPLELEADFSVGTISGCAGCDDGIVMTPATYNLATGQITRGTSLTIDYEMNLGETRYLDTPDSLGTFIGDLGVDTHAGALVGSGGWRGRFSSVLNSDDVPRLVAGTLDGQFTHSSLTYNFDGIWVGDAQAPAARTSTTTQAPSSR